MGLLLWPKIGGAIYGTMAVLDVPSLRLLTCRKPGLQERQTHGSVGPMTILS
ncbi:hypothetical protein PISMIDRAFT_689784 [Pisolithus microcarpus 441]|uniref:Uncharacterized protein n=1 Tax=Pisolithus microcarpus 441 TaxID=765257 RepID=A0A0C9YW55_9AGAM|nr:hypothetical protein BKA83DRAFT_689784 [Pisolithus microcarpus]KIK12123.1 hypothetical protein PISMIDRAFT_689784 [Pisolithus microcarpus 441]